MEDAHIAEDNLPDNVSLFGVFDGHGGPEVAKFVAKSFTATLTQNKHFISKNYETALYETFLAMDEQLLSPEGQK